MRLVVSIAADKYYIITLLLLMQDMMNIEEAEVSYI